MKRYFVLFLLGTLLGGALVLLWYGHQLEETITLNRNLTLENERLKEDIESLKQSQKVAKKRQTTLVEEIKVAVLNPKPQALHAIIEAELIRQLEKDLAPLKGKKTEQVADFHLLLHELLERREYVIDRTKVEVRLKTVVCVSQVLQVYVTVSVKPVDLGTIKPKP